MILADENIDNNIIAALRKSGIAVYSIAESNPSIEDEKVIEISRKPPRIILTEDKDFGEWVFAHHVKNISVVFLRYDFKDTDKMTSILIDLFKKRMNNLQNKFTTITVKKIRIRSLPE